MESIRPFFFVAHLFAGLDSQVSAVQFRRNTYIPQMRRMGLEYLPTFTTHFQPFMYLQVKTSSPIWAHIFIHLLPTEFHGASQDLCLDGMMLFSNLKASTSGVLPAALLRFLPQMLQLGPRIKENGVKTRVSRILPTGTRGKRYPKSSPKFPKEKEFLQKLKRWNIWGTFQGYVGEILESCDLFLVESFSCRPGWCHES